MDASSCADEWWWFQCACPVVLPVEDQSRWLWHHFMMSQGSLMLLREGTIKGVHNQTLGLSYGFSGTKHLGLLTSHQPSTLAVLVPLMEKSITRMECVTCLSYACTQTFLGNPQLVWLQLFDSSQVGHYLHPLEPGIEQSTDHNPLEADCKGGINC